MALIACTECGKEISEKAAACPHCGAPMEASEKAKKDERAQYTATFDKSNHGWPTWFKVLGTVIVVAGLFSCFGSGKSSGGKSSVDSFDWNDALVMCQSALKRVSRDPEKAEVPYVPNHGTGDEFYFAWGASTKMARMRNGLGLEVAVSASCIVSKSQKRITSLILNGKSIL